jgi:murein DD-endopeptidase MepM/ murein hydrolase activator NlpD
MAYLQGKVNEYNLKKTLTPDEQIKLDTAKANLAKIQADTAQVGVTDASKAIAGIRAIDSDTTLTQTQKDQLKEKLGFTKANTTGDFELKDISGVPYIFDKRNGSVKNISGTGSPSYTDVGNGIITQQYGANSPLTKDNVPLQSGVSGTPGIDFDGNLGDAVRSFVAGTVISVANDPNYGNQVKIQDASGNTHIYSHLQNLPTYLLNKTVLGGDVIGEIGNTGNVLKMSGQKPTADELASGVGSHLDYRVWSKDAVKGSHWADPNSFIGKIDIRSDVEYAISTITKIPAKNRAKLEGDVNALLGKGKQSEASRLVLNAVYDYSTADEQKELSRQNAIRFSLSDIKSVLKDAQTKGIDTGIWTYLKSSAGKAVGMEDPDLTKIRTRMDKALQEYRLAISGAAFGVQEAIGYQEVNPSLYAGNEANNAIVDSGIDISNSRIRNFFEQPLGSKVYDQLKSQLDPQDKFNDSFQSKTKEPSNLKSIKTLPTDVQSKIYDQVEAELNSGTPVGEVRQTLIDQGYDPSDFITE